MIQFQIGLCDQSPSTPKSLLIEKEQYEIDRANQIFEAHQNESPEQLFQILTREGINTILIKQLIQDKNYTNKKGIFNLFK